LIQLIQGRDIFLKGLSSLSDEILTLIATAKHASLQTIRQNVLHLGWEIEEAECNRLVLKALEQEEKKRLGMAESDYRFFKKLMVDRDLPALSQDVEYLRAAHNSEIESLASADEQMFQISTITPYATKYVAHRLPLHPNSSDTEYEPGEQDCDDDPSGDEAEGTSTFSAHGNENYSGTYLFRLIIVHQRSLEATISLSCREAFISPFFSLFSCFLGMFHSYHVFRTFVVCVCILLFE
jgi:hypothetical protein